MPDLQDPDLHQNAMFTGPRFNPAHIQFLIHLEQTSIMPVSAKRPDDTHIVRRQAMHGLSKKVRGHTLSKYS